MMVPGFALRATFLFFVLQLSPVIYQVSTIDTLGYASSDTVQIEGIVGGLDRDDGVISFRLVDSHGHYRKCVLPKGMDPPRVGAHLTVKGTRKFYPTGVTEIDPVAAIVPVED